MKAPRRFVLLAVGAMSAMPWAARSGQSSDWPLIGGNEYEQHFSPLRQIDAASVKQLKLAWYADMPTADGLTGVPLVVDGVIYQSGGLGKAWAHDARTGKMLWEFDAHIEFPLGVVPSWGARMSRGLAVWGDRVLKATGDCRLFSLDRRTGAVVWEATTCDVSMGRTITGAPRVGDGKVFIGNADADTGSGRGHVDAFDIASGKHLWRFYVVPGDPAEGFESAVMKLASATWSEQSRKHARGGSPWEGITYDPRTRLVYVGTDGPSPADPGLRGSDAGDELFTNAIVALRADDGEYVWHYSMTPHDGWNFAATMPVVLADLRIEGRKREVLLHAPKNGFFYVLDARTGRLLNEPRPIVPVSWASRIDMKTGRPVQNPAAWYWKKGAEGAVVSPGPMGAHSWMPMSFNPHTGLVYIPVTDYPMRMTTNPDQRVGSVDVDFYGSLQDGGPFKGQLLAWDPVAQRERWRRDIGRPYQGGTLSTAGNLVFQGTTRGELIAYRADTGERMWTFPVGSGVLAAPSTALLDGKQLVFIAAGSGTTSSLGFSPLFADRADGPARLLAFSLTGSAKLPRVANRVDPLPKPAVPEPLAALALRGKSIWDANGCELCHGIRAIGGLGSVPDLRRSVAMPLEAFAAIVRGGALGKQGMPEFSASIAETDLEPLQAYLRAQAWRAYRESVAPKGSPKPR